MKPDPTTGICERTVQIPPLMDCRGLAERIKAAESGSFVVYNPKTEKAYFAAQRETGFGDGHPQRNYHPHNWLGGLF